LLGTASEDRKLFTRIAPLGSFIAGRSVPAELTREDVFFSPLFPSKERLAKAHGENLKRADDFEASFDRMLRAEFFRTLESYALLAWLRAANLGVLFLLFGSFAIASMVDARCDGRSGLKPGCLPSRSASGSQFWVLAAGFTALSFMLIWPAPLAGWVLGAVGILMGISAYGAAFHFRRTRG